MSTPSPAPARPGPVRALLGILLIALGVCLLCWAAFQILRGPSTCGGDAPACPDGFLPALLGGFASFFVVIPVGIALSPKVSGLFASVTALISGGLAATVYSSRFVADPITDATVGTWIAVGCLGTVSLLALLAVVRPGPGAEAAQARLRALRDAQEAAAASGSSAKTSSSSGASGSKSSATSSSARSTTGTTSARATARTADGTQIDLGMDTIRQLLVHGLANGELATKVDIGRLSPDHKPDVQRLLDLHRKGVIDDDALRDALAALRTR